MEKYVAVRSVCVLCVSLLVTYILFLVKAALEESPTTTPFSFGGEERLENEIGPFSWAQDREPPAAASSHRGSKKKKK